MNPAAILFALAIGCEGKVSEEVIMEVNELQEMEYEFKEGKPRHHPGFECDGCDAKDEELARLRSQLAAKDKEVERLTERAESAERAMMTESILELGVKVKEAREVAHQWQQAVISRWDLTESFDPVNPDGMIAKLVWKVECERDAARADAAAMMAKNK